ncbi:uncharacterized protein A1O5_03334 [Cladophialophora psammophila CBS 110553]|uniref:Mitochondrial thiamine pyrophosphate carrier 1 n=1 Tax=Cladophialophora psammophila CBS 110553 TaxID=1182543 RepID=W9X048_9EURO|nr:uncharacterized protein A1O5_03334 [Cladophialophora psammophila CBS 110553]EXJ73573.1 hypothetical protein A1O5_03334 [Cladophialophora psammophila CBS 110553]
MPAASTSSSEKKQGQGQRQMNNNIRYPFWFGGSASSMAACVTHPLDLGANIQEGSHGIDEIFKKVRLQTQAQTIGSGAPKTMRGTVVRIFQTEGVLGFYSGISASLLRQLTYATVRFGLYEEMKQRASSNPSFPLLVAMASVSGFAGGVAGNFADVLNVRMQHDSALPAHARRNYKHAVDGMVRMAREEGLRGWFRGWVPNSSRAAVQTASQLASYDVAKRLLRQYTPLGDDTLPTQLTASFLAGITAATVTSPIDVIKTRVMSATGTQQPGIVEIIKTVSRNEGPRWMFKGWLPSFLRLGPHTICIFIFLELHRKVYRGLQQGQAVDGADGKKDGERVAGAGAGVGAGASPISTTVAAPPQKL